MNPGPIYVGLDPGVRGGAAVLSQSGYVFRTLSFTTATEGDICDFMHKVRVNDHRFALLEKVASSPQMGVRSAFTFGRTYGFLRGLLKGHGIAFDEVTPGKWQKPLGLISSKKLTDTEKKRKNREKAEQLFPGEKITNATADALLIAYYLKNFYNR